MCFTCVLYNSFEHNKDFIAILKQNNGFLIWKSNLFYGWESILCNICFNV